MPQELVSLLNKAIHIAVNDG